MEGTAAKHHARYRRYLKLLGIDGTPRGEGDDKIFPTREAIIGVGVPQELTDWFSSVLRRFLRMADSRAAAGLPLSAAHDLSFDDGTAGVEWISSLLNVPLLFWPFKNWGTPDVTKFLTELQTTVTERVVSLVPYHHDLSREAEHGYHGYELFAGGWETFPLLAYFPFYLLDERRQGWGVFDFAEQERICIVLSAELANDTKLFLERVDTNAITCDKAAFHKLLQHIQSTCRHTYFLHLGMGHAAFRIAMNSVRPTVAAFIRMNLYAVDRYQRINKLCEYIGAGDPGSGAGGMEPVGEWAKCVFEILTVKKSYPPEARILVSDIGDPLIRKLRSSPDLADKLVFIELRHQLGIPVGLGFSLATVPLLLKENAALLRLLWFEVRSAVARYGSEIEAAFTEDGLKLKTKQALIADTHENVPIPREEEALNKIRELCSRLIHDAGPSKESLQDLIEGWSSIPKDRREKIVALVNATADPHKVQAEDLLPYVKKIIKIIN